ARPEAGGDAPQNGEILATAREVPERGEEVEGKVEGVRSHEPAHVVLDELDLDARLGRALARPREEKAGAVDGGHREAASRQGDGVPRGAAAEVEHRAALHPGEGEDRSRLVLAEAEALREGDGIHALPER